MYHVNPETGKFDICHASCPENCPFGVENHSERYEEDIRYKIRGGYSTDDIKKAIEITEEYYNKLPVEPDWLSRTDLELYKYLIEKTDYAKIQCDWIKKENNSLVLQKAV